MLSGEASRVGLSVRSGILIYFGFGAIECSIAFNDSCLGGGMKITDFTICNIEKKRI